MRLKFRLNLCGYQRILWDPSDPTYKNRDIRRGFVSANRRSVRLARSDGLALVIAKNRRDRRRLGEVDLRQVGEAILRTALTPVYRPDDRVWVIK